MKLDLKGIRVVKCDFRNEMGPNAKLNLQVGINNQIKLPKEITPTSTGSILTKIMVGSPMEPLYLYIEQITSFGDSDQDKNVLDTQSLMSLYKTICVPMAMREVEATIKRLCAVYRIPEIQIQKKPGAAQGGNGYLN